MSSPALAVTGSKSLAVNADLAHRNVGVFRQGIGGNNTYVKRLNIEFILQVQLVDHRRRIENKRQAFAGVLPILHAGPTQTEEGDSSGQILAVFAGLGSFRQIEIHAESGRV